MADRWKTTRFWTYVYMDFFSCQYVKNTLQKYWTTICNHPILILTTYLCIKIINLSLEQLIWIDLLKFYVFLSCVKNPSSIIDLKRTYYQWFIALYNRMRLRAKLATHFCVWKTTVSHFFSKSYRTEHLDVITKTDGVFGPPASNITTLVASI